MIPLSFSIECGQSEIDAVGFGQMSVNSKRGEIPNRSEKEG